MATYINNLIGGKVKILTPSTPEPSTDVFTYFLANGNTYKARLTTIDNSSDQITCTDGTTIDKSDIVKVWGNDGCELTSIGNYAFSDCTNLQSIVIPSDVTSIGDGAFNCCIGLTSMDMSKATNLTSIGEAGISVCQALTTLTIPSSVTSIGSVAFVASTGLTSITFQGKTLAQVQAMDNYPWGIENTLIINTNTSPNFNVGDANYDTFEELFK